MQRRFSDNSITELRPMNPQQQQQYPMPSQNQVHPKLADSFAHREDSRAQFAGGAAASFYASMITTCGTGLGILGTFFACFGCNPYRTINQGSYKSVSILKLLRFGWFSHSIRKICSNC